MGISVFLSMKLAGGSFWNSGMFLGVDLYQGLCRDLFGDLAVRIIVEVSVRFSGPRAHPSELTGLTVAAPFLLLPGLLATPSLAVVS